MDGKYAHVDGQSKVRIEKVCTANAAQRCELGSDAIELGRAWRVNGRIQYNKVFDYLEKEFGVKLCREAMRQRLHYRSETQLLRLSKSASFLDII